MRLFPLLWGIRLREAQKDRGAQGIEAEILFCGHVRKKDCSGKPGFFARLWAKKCAMMINIEY
jgi:hypothetical protein